MRTESTLVLTPTLLILYWFLQNSLIPIPLYLEIFPLISQLLAERRPISQTTPELPPLADLGNDPAPTGFLGALGLGGLASLGRRSWFRNLDSHRYSPDFTIEPFTDQDVETGRATLSPSRTVDSTGRRVGTGPDGTRPKSTSSARSATSAGTIYHDAHSSVPGTPVLPLFQGYHYPHVGMIKMQTYPLETGNYCLFLIVLFLLL